MSEQYRTLKDYVNAIYPCKVYECSCECVSEYIAISLAYPSGLGSSWISINEAIDDLRIRIETDIREIIEGDRDWWMVQGDKKKIPLPSELSGTYDDNFDIYLQEDGCKIIQKYDTNIKVFPKYT
jgi:hypothetical protein